VEKAWLLLGRDSRDVLILASDGSQMTNLVDVYELAKHMGYGDSDGRHRQRNHWHEILVWGGISGDSYTFLAIFPATNAWDSTMRVGRIEVTVPKDFADFHSRPGSFDLPRALADETYMHTGLHSEPRLRSLMAALTSDLFQL
jgi:hypothetical protein